jgi:hypothetical protein
MDDNSILNIPVVPGPMRTQKDVDIFFHKQFALQRQKVKESEEKRKNRGSRDLNKTAEELKQLANLVPALQITNDKDDRNL